MSNEGKEDLEVHQKQNSSEKSLWLIHGIVGLFLCAAVYAITCYYQWLESISWGYIIFLIPYTLILLFSYSYFTKQASDCSPRSSLRPNGLTRFRSYLTFLPITHIIQHGDGKESLRTNETLITEGLRENELSIRINLQKELAIEAILDEYIAPWYTKISSNTIFLQQSREILQSVFNKLGDKIKQVDRNELAKEAIQTVHLHWKEYCEASDNASASEDILKRFKFVHPFLQDTLEVSKRYERMICGLLERLDIPDLHSTVLCQFLSGILVKSFFLYYADLLCQPSWINTNLISLLRSGSLLAELTGSSSQNSSAPVTPQPERSPKTIPGENYSFPTPTCSESSINGFGYESPKSSASLEQNKEERYFFGKESLDTNTEFDSGYSGSQSNSKAFTFQEKVGESPSKTGIKCNIKSVTTALSEVLPTSTLPLLGMGCYDLDGCQKFEILKPNKSPPNEKLSAENSLQEYSHQRSIEIQSLETENFCDSCNDDQSEVFTTSQEKNIPENIVSKIPTHYYSFDEASKRKPNLFLDSGTLSVDGALDACKQDKSSTHLLILNKSEVETGIKPNRSPVYEEPEDFATSIAKLRSLLEQRDSKNNLTDEDRNFPPEMDQSLISSNEYNNEISDKLFSNGSKYLQEEDAEASDGLQNDKTEQPLSFINSCISKERKSEEDDLERFSPELKCHFFNITIPKVESCNEHGGQYDFYCIQYEGVYFDEIYDYEPPKVILRTTTVKRRFKEFVMLQSKLEERSQWKPHLKGIKAPNRWLNLSFSKADTAVTRKSMLEKYLHQICYHPILGTSHDVLQFMAYGDDGFYPDPLDVHDPKHLLSDKLDKLAKKFTGVMNSLKDVFPSFESNPPSPHSEVGFPIDMNTQIKGIPSFQFSERLSPEEREGPQELSSALGTKWLETLVPLSVRDKLDNNDDDDQATNEIISDDLVDEGRICSSYPLAAALTQLLCDVLWLPNCRPHNVSVSTFMSISGKSLENYVQETVDVFLSEEAVLGYLEWVTKSLKAEIDLFQDQQQPYDSSSELNLKNCLRRRIPTWARWMWGRNRLDVTIERITGFFQNPTINHDLVLSLSELIFSKIV